MNNKVRAVCVCAALVLTAGGLNTGVHALTHTSLSPLAAGIWSVAALIAAGSLLVVAKESKEHRD